ncbi:MAG: LuxR C-terminal-related transcriptional regulator, partial [Thermomicrobiales bacterium]
DIDPETLSIFAELSENSFLVRGTDFGLLPRFSMLMTIRSFGQRKLRENGEWDRARARHAEWFYSLAIRASQTSTSISDPDWFDWLEIEHENLRLALDWYQTCRDLTRFAAFANSLVQFWLIRSHVGEGARWLQQVLDTDDGSSIDQLTRARLLDAAGWMALRQGRIDDFRTFAEQSLIAARLCGESRQIASSLRLLGEVEDRSTNYDVAAIHIGEAYRIYRQAGNLTGVADTLASLGGLALDSGDLDQAVRLFERGIEAATAAEDIHLCARVTNALSVTRFTRGEFALALTCAEQSLAWNIRVGDTRGMAVALDHIGRYSRALGEFKRAWENHQASLEKRRQFGEMRGLVVWLELVNELLLSRGAYEAAACVLGGTEGMRQRGAHPLHNHELPERKTVFETIRRHLAPDIVRQLGERGAAMSLQELIDFAWSKADAAVNDDPDIVVATVDRFARFGLTARELEIAELLVNRRSDREIADQLFISPRTANAHITRVLKKLDVHSRRDVARMLGEVPAE